jgi:hypothetical protein
MRILGTIVVASAALMTGTFAAAAAPATSDNATIITPHAFAKGVDVQTGRSAAVDTTDGISDKYRFSIGFTPATTPCDTARILSLFCRDAN